MSLRLCFDVAAQEADHVKVRLFFHTWEPKHVRSHYLKNEVSAAPPFLEDICVLVPVNRAYDRLSAYQAIFLALQEAGILAKADVLKAFELCVEDTHTLAYRETETTSCLS